MRIQLIALVFLPAFLSGCSVQELVIAEETALIVASTSVDEAFLLDVGIVEFEAGIPKNNNPEKTGVLPFQIDW